MEANKKLHTIVLEFSAEGLEQVAFVHGFQTWNLSRARCLPEHRRQKSLGSKMGFSGMFHETDALTWGRSDGIESHGFCIVKDKQGEYIILGATTSKRASSSFWITRSGKITWYIDYGYDGIKAVHAKESIYVARGSDPVMLVEAFADVTAANADNIDEEALQLRSVLRDLGRPPVGWGSWYEFYDKITAADMCTAIKRIDGDPVLKRNIDVIQLDDGFQKQTGDWLDTRKRFKGNGGGDIHKIAQDIEAAGYTPGIWTAPFLASATSNVYKDHPEWFVKRRSKPSRHLVGHTNPAWKRSFGPKSMVHHILDLSEMMSLRT